MTGTVLSPLYKLTSKQPTLLTSKLRLREMKSLGRDHTARKWGGVPGWPSG